MTLTYLHFGTRPYHYVLTSTALCPLLLSISWFPARSEAWREGGQKLCQKFSVNRLQLLLCFAEGSDFMHTAGISQGRVH